MFLSRAAAGPLRKMLRTLQQEDQAAMIRATHVWNAALPDPGTRDTVKSDLREEQILVNLDNVEYVTEGAISEDYSRLHFVSGQIIEITEPYGTMLLVPDSTKGS